MYLPWVKWNSNDVYKTTYPEGSHVYERLILNENYEMMYEWLILTEAMSEI